MPDGTPQTTSQVSNAWAVHRGRQEQTHDPRPFHAEFDAWLAAHDAMVRAPLEAEVERLQAAIETGKTSGRMRRALEEQRARTEAAEAKVRAGLELTMVPYGWLDIDGDRQAVVLLDDLRAALADPTPEAGA